MCIDILYTCIDILYVYRHIIYMFRHIIYVYRHIIYVYRLTAKSFHKPYLGRVRELTDPFYGNYIIMNIIYYIDIGNTFHLNIIFSILDFVIVTVTTSKHLSVGFTLDRIMSALSFLLFTIIHLKNSKNVSTRTQDHQTAR